ncbi:MAG: HAMP domain-containing sensor histidine kinase, partial [Myxococcota bacterium]
RVDDRAQMLYWSGHLLDEIERLPLSRPQTSNRGEMHWVQSERGLWAMTRWDDGYYIFGLDLAAILIDLKGDARTQVPLNAELQMFLLGPGEAFPESYLDDRVLMPWLSDWSVVAVIRDPQAMAREQSRNRLQRILIIAFAIMVMVVGAIFSTRLISRELDVARMKTDFAANVSHELRSPITQIRLKAESLLFGLADTPEELDAHYQVILRESERLSRLVDNVLDYSAIDRGSKQYVLRPGDLADTVHRAVDNIQTSYEVREMDVEVNVPFDLPVVHHDADAITQCLINLISNAAKYSSATGSRWIGVLGRVVEGGVEIAVSDRGIGIAADDIKRIFEPFYRSRDANARRQKGTGIGLTITRYIMDAHGGSISVQSRPGKGSTFTLRFPLQPPGQ